ncbi:hypothetical protein HZA41_01360 [Candidatus Peregrinibacteria bacterium]|nr:hypothetical protein [Candidatus Peregrinibacteria bacterium]
MRTVNFPGQAEGEIIELVLRKHWIAHFNVLFFLFLFGIVPLGVYFALLVNFFSQFQTNIVKIVSAFFSIYLLFIVLVTFIKWLNEELDVLIITNKRIVSVNQISFLSREVAESELSQIQDVKGGNAGFLSTILDYGTLEAQTAAEKILFRVEKIPKPVFYVRLLINLKNQHRTSHVPQ